MKRHFMPIIVLTLALTVSASSWAGPKTTGYTDVTTQWFDNDTRVEFTVINNTNSSSPLYYLGNPYVVLVDKFEILAPSYTGSVTANSVPTGWTWKKNSSFTNAEVADMSGKYYVPYSIAPGQSLTFGLTFDINLYRDAIWSFETHVLAVNPYPDSNGRYTEVLTDFGNTWFDAPGDCNGGTPHEPVPEASTLIGFGSALAMVSPGIAGWLRRRKI